jgi:hypothetical protein
MKSADAIVILYLEFVEAARRAAVRIGPAPCEAPEETIIATRA